MEEPVDHIVDVVDALHVSLAALRFVREVNARDPAMLVALAEEVLVVEQRQLLDDVVHDQVRVYRGLVTDYLLVSVAQLHHLLDLEALVWVQLQHACDNSSELLAVFFIKRRELALRDSLEEIVERQILFVILTEGRAEHAQLVGNAAQRPHI